MYLDETSVLAKDARHKTKAGEDCATGAAGVARVGLEGDPENPPGGPAVFPCA